MISTKKRQKKKSKTLLDRERTILAKERTLLARERTMLAQQRNILTVIGISIAFAGLGFALVHFFEQSSFRSIVFLGWTFVFLSLVIITYSFSNYRNHAKKIKNFRKENGSILNSL